MKSLTCIVETPKGYGVKYKYDPELACLVLRKILPAGLVFPFDFGFLPGTIGEDGDPLDVIIIAEHACLPGSAMECRIIGGITAMQQEKEGARMRNDRYLAVPEVSVLYKNIQSMGQLPREITQQLENFFINYNAQAGKKFTPVKHISAAQAIKTIQNSREEAEPTHLIQLLLPLNDNKGRYFPQKMFTAVKNKLLKEFGGVTVYTQSPASGLWAENNTIKSDHIMVYEVMAAA